ncbi:MAG: hypothetical protein J5614_00690, partial [Paludibacteraceae bacterium]|nr:hypothetical protein [Paludibacteraceae bacterium]
MSEQFDSFINACAAAVKSKEQALPAEFLAAAKSVGSTVEAWGTGHGIMTPKKFPRGGGNYFVPNAKVDTDKLEQSLGAEAVA